MIDVISGPYRIQSVTSADLCRRLEDLQKQIWGMPDRDIVAAHEMIAYQKSGGLVLAAFAGNDLVGFLSSFCGQRGGRLILWSDMMGCTAEHRSRSLGFALKNVQRDYALGIGIETVCWTFDPLEGGNATLNIRKLGGLVRRYEEDCYGPIGGSLIGALPTDRFVVDWEIATPRVVHRLQHPDPSHPPHLDQFPVANHGAPVATVHLGLRSKTLLVEIPESFQDVKQADPRAALSWRLNTRLAFQHYLDHDYEVSEFYSIVEDGRRRNLYLLSAIRMQ